MSEILEIRTELTLAGIEQLKNEFRTISSRIGDTDKAREGAQKGFGSWMQTAHSLAGVLGVSLSSIADRVHGIGAAFIDAGSAAETGDQAIGALIASAQGKDAQAAVETARMLGDYLDEVAVSAGVSGAAMEDAYQIVLERTGATEQGIVRATEATESLALISAKLGKNTSAIAGEYAFMLEGQLKVKGQMFQLLQSTGIFGSDTKKAAEAWGQLSDEKRAELLSFGLDKLSSKMKELPPTYAQASATFENMIRISKEKVGEPIIRELTPALRELSEDILKMGPDLEELGTVLSKEVAGGVREGGRLMKEALGWAKDHKSEIADALKTSAKALRDAFEFAVAHKGEIAFALGAKTLGPGALGAGKAVVGGIATAASVGSGGAIAGVSGAAGAVASLGLLGIAIAALGGIAYAEYALIKGLGDAADDHTEGLRRLSALAKEGNVENVDNAARSMRELDRAAGRATPELEEFYLSMMRMGRTAQSINSMDIGAQVTKQIGMSQNALRDIDKAAELTGTTVQQQVSNQTAILLNAYNQAAAAGNTAMATLAAQTLASNEQVKRAFLTTTTDVEGGFAAMADMLSASGSQFSGFATQLKGKAAQPPAPKILMPGAKITVTQDFRKADPDNVAVAFKKDIARAAERRASARYSGVFGF